MLTEPTDVLVSLVSLILLFSIQFGLVLYSSLLRQDLASFLVLGFAYDSSRSAEILAHSRYANYRVFLL